MGYIRVEERGLGDEGAQGRPSWLYTGRECIIARGDMSIYTWAPGVWDFASAVHAIKKIIYIRDPQFMDPEYHEYAIHERSLEWNKSDRNT